MSRKPLAWATAALLATVAPAASQSFDADGPLRPLRLPAEASGRPRSPEPPAPALPRLPAAKPGPAAELTSALRRFPTLPGAMTVEGHAGVLTWPVFVTGREARAPAVLRLAPRASLAVRPDTSQAVVSLNGVDVGRLRVGLPDEPVSLPIPAGVLQPGYNAVRVTARLDHRVDCTVQAGSELALAFDRADTGLLPAASGLESLADLAAVSADADGTLRIALQTGSGPMPGDLVDRVARVVQSVALIAGTSRILVDAGSASDGAEGLQLRVGTGAETPGLHDRGPGNAPLLAVVGRTPGELDKAVEDLEALAASSMAHPSGTPDGLLARAAVMGRSSHGDAVPFEAVPFLGPRVTTSALVVLPADMLPADYGQATVRLRGALAPGVLRGARMTVAVNGRTIASAAFARGHWGGVDEASVVLPYGLLRPGANRIEATAELPMAEDAVCDPARTARSVRFVPDAGSGITLSPVARAHRPGDLAAWRAGASALSSDVRPVLHLPRPDRGSLAAALTISAALARAAGAVTPFRFSAGAEPDGPGSSLTVGPIGALGEDLIRRTGIDPDAVGVDPTRSGKPIGCEAPAGTRPRPADRLPWWDPASWSQRMARALRWPTASGSGASGPAPTGSLLVAADRERPSTVVVTARDSATLAEATACLTQASTWDRLSGRVALLDRDGAGLAIIEGAPTAMTPAGWDPGNARRVLAGWLSLNPLAFLSATGVALIFASLTSLGVVRRSGRRTS